MSQNEVSSVVKLPLEPDKEAISTIDGQSRICNWLYNDLLGRAKDGREEFIRTQDSKIAQTVYSERGLRNLVPKIKEEHPFLRTVHSSPLKNTALRLSSAIQAHQKSKKGKRKGKLIKWPKFHSWKKSWFSLFYDEPNKGFKIEDDQLILSLGVGQDNVRRSVRIPMKEAHLLKGKGIRNLRIIKENGIYFAIFTVRKILPERKGSFAKFKLQASASKNSNA